MFQLYIDPGTGSMLFTVLIGIVGAAFYSLRTLMIKIRFKLGVGKQEKINEKNPYVIFSDNKRYWSIFEPICREMSKRNQKVFYITASPDDPALECKFENFNAKCIENENKLFAKLNYINADIVLSTTPGLDVYQWKRSKEVKYYVHIPHAANDITLYRMFGIDYYDAILLSGDYQIEEIRALEELRKLPPKELVKVGIPYMDEMAKKAVEAPVVSEKAKTVLLAPSWGPSAIFGVYGGKIIEALLKTDYHIIVRPHPQSFTSEKEMLDKLIKEYPNSDRLEWNKDLDNFDALHRSDILISDFSGVIFDFSLIHDKPVIYTNPNLDLSVYDAWWLEKPLWTTSALTKLGRELNENNIDNIEELIDSCLTDARYAEGRQAVKEETWANVGNGAQVVADYLIRKYDELSDKEGA